MEFWMTKKHFLAQLIKTKRYQQSIMEENNTVTTTKILEFSTKFKLQTVNHGQINKIMKILQITTHQKKQVNHSKYGVLMDHKSVWHLVLVFINR